MIEYIDQDRWIFLREVCEYLGLKRHTVMRWIEQQNIPASKVGKLLWFRIFDIDQWIRIGGTSEGQEGDNE